MSKTILITGGSRGIGAATARLAAMRGYHVCINYLNRADCAQQLADDIGELGGKADVFAADIADERSVMRLFDDIDRLCGRLDVLVNNAGILETQSRLDGMEAARMERVFRTNILGCFLCAREAVRRMSTRHGGEGGAIVNLSSGAARLGSPGEYVDYAASKGAIDTLTTGLAKEVAAEGIRVNAVRPGYIYTDIHASGGEPGRVDRLKSRVPMQRGGQAEEVAEAILWLASDAAGYSTGTFIDVTGGN